jgi:hypothetical protein
MSDAALREQLRRLLDWSDAHVGFDAAVADLPAELRGRVPPGLPYSPWQLVEHLRITQRDILDFCADSGYHELNWPADYWPAGTAPDDDAAWEASLAAYRADRTALQALAEDTSRDLFAPLPQGDGQTLLRELLLAADHAAYHLGELVVARRLLGAWHPG